MKSPWERLCAGCHDCSVSTTDLSNLAHRRRIALTLFELGPAWAEKACRQYLNQTKGNQVKHFAWTGSKNAMLIVVTKPNPSETTLKIVLGQQVELTGVALTHKGIRFWEHNGGSWIWSDQSSTCGTFHRYGKAVVSVKIGQCSDRKDRS